MRQTIYSIPPILKIVIYIVFFSSLVVASGQATTYVVGKNYGDFSSISSAVNKAQAGDTIFVNSGTYFENIHISKRLYLIGKDTGNGQPVIDGMQKDFAIGIHGDDIWVEGFTVRNCTQDPENRGIGIFIGAEGVYTPQRNFIINNTAINNNIGIGIYYSKDLIIQGNKVEQNREGINLNRGTNITIVNNSISYHNNNGIYSGNYGSNNTILRNEIIHSATGIRLDSSDSNIIDHNTIYDSGLSALTVTKSKGNVIRNNLINLTLVHGLDITSNSEETVVDSNQFLFCDRWGIYSINSERSALINNHIYYSNGGIALHKSSNNSLWNNQLIEIQKFDGILLESSSNLNSVVNNTVTNSKGGAIHLSWSNDNAIYLNNFNIESFTILESSSNISWTSPDPIDYRYQDHNFTARLGNYWKGYRGQDINHDGIGDIPYQVSGDTSPLFGQWEGGIIFLNTLPEASPSILPNPDNRTIFSFYPLLLIIAVVVLLSLSWYARDAIKTTIINRNKKIQKPSEIASRPKEEEKEETSSKTKEKIIEGTVPTAIDRKTHHDVFISYSNLDKPIADAVCAHLERDNVRCWIAPRDVLPGQNFLEGIIDAIDQCRIMVLIFSSNSNNSPHVIRELTRAVKREVIIIPFRIENIEPSKSMEYLISVPHWLDAISPPLEQHIEKLTEIVQMLIKRQ